LKLTGLLGYMEEALDMGAATESSALAALVRVPEIPLGSEESWREVAVVRLEVDDGDIDVILDPDCPRSMSVSELRAWAAALPAESLDHDLFVPGPVEPVKGEWSARRDVPVIAAVFNPEDQLFGVMPWYEGCEAELEMVHEQDPGPEG